MTHADRFRELLKKFENIDNVYDNRYFARMCLHYEMQIAKGRAALEKINEIRNSIIGLGTINWSEHVYPLVAALNEVGYEGEDYSEARERFGTMLERTLRAERDQADLQLKLVEEQNRNDRLVRTNGERSGRIADLESQLFTVRQKNKELLEERDQAYNEGYRAGQVGEIHGCF